MTTISLDGAWTFRCPRPTASAPRALKLRRWMPVTVPGTVHHALVSLGRIPDPFVGRNELDVQWIDEQDWEFRRAFVVPRDALARARCDLVFEGLDTVCEISVNGRELARSENMFRRVVVDARDALVAGRNELTLRFRSPTRYALDRFRASDQYTDAGDFRWPTGERRETGRIWIRKAQCHFGWDWGPCLATSGPWLPSRLECEDAPRIDSIQIAQRHEGPVAAPTRVVLDIAVRLTSPTAMRGGLALSWAGPATDERGGVRRDGGLRIDPTPRELAVGENVLATSLVIDAPRLWWPNGAGEQALYELDVRWTDADGGRVAEAARRIGLRTIELVTEADAAPDGARASSFVLRVNGRALFAKGANWIPPDQFVDRCTPNVYRHLLAAMRDAHMNLVRVWGGGWYELELFYDLCDELGLMVWQDVMLACAPYPDTAAFVGELTREAAWQVQRLQHRACVALWCGDNEDLLAAQEWWGKRPGQHERFWTMYRNLMTPLRACVEREDPTRRFWLSSPSNGDFDDRPNDPNHGDVHYWAVWHGHRPFSDYLSVRPRFASEFGFQSFPEARTLAPFVAKPVRNPSSRIMEHHQRSDGGNVLIAHTLARELPVPHGFAAFCIASQITQMLAVRTAVEHWRRCKPWTMGAVYWQLNDLWPVASWSSIDWVGRWKALHHAATRFFAPLLASVVHADGALTVWATSDVGERLALTGALEVFTWSGRRVATRPLRAGLAADESRAIATFAVADLLRGGAEAHDVCVFVRLAGGGHVATNFANLVPWKWAELPDPRVRATLGQARDGALELALTSRGVAAFAHADLDGLEGHFAGSFDVLRPGATHRWRWVPHVERGATRPTLRDARKRLRVRTLRDLGEP